MNNPNPESQVDGPTAGRFPKNVLVVSYSQSGQLDRIVAALHASLRTQVLAIAEKLAPWRPRRSATQTGSHDARLLAGSADRALRTAFVSHFLSGASVSAISGGAPHPAGLFALTLASQFQATH
jgi:hypothetical protein